VSIQSTKKKKTSARSDKKKPKIALIVAILIAVGLVVVVDSGILSKKESVPQWPTNTPPGQDRLTDLVGRWARTDGNYIIEIRTIDADGKMDAGYFNPRPVNVSTAEAFLTSNGAKVYLQLHDVGYPGSTYLLNHDSDRDTLVGIYFQAALQQYFDVEFARIK